MRKVIINKNDILESIYFITAKTQKQSSATMQGALSSKGDLMGGIFDRWINTIPESIVFNKLIIPEIDNSGAVTVISDFYIYDPKIVGIAPDILGLKIKNKSVPFVVFEERWKPVDGMPQIEIKTFKKPQKMISLRNQNYDNKYLVMAETELRIDYLLPFIDTETFTDKIYQNLIMNDSVFVISNPENKIQCIEKVKLLNNVIGTVALLKITNAKSFMEYSTLCEGTVSVQYINNIEEKQKVPNKELLNIELADMCDKRDLNLYRLNYKWYEGITTEGIPYYNKKSKGSNNRFLYRTLDLYIENIEAITIIKKSITSIYIKVNQQARINEHILKKDCIYKVEFAILDRSSNNGEEFFLQKSLIQYIPDYDIELKNILKKIIKKESKNEIL